MRRLPNEPAARPDAPVLLVTTRPGALPPPGASSRRADASTPSVEGTATPETSEPNDPVAATSRVIGLSPVVQETTFEWNIHQWELTQ